jgi:formylglycine-generating enzyme required for sulfatase activity
VPIEGGDYPLGSDEGLYQDEAPAHTVTLTPYAIGRFPVTKAEWQCFLEARGYEDERWWDTEAGQRWRRGEDTAEGPKRQWRDNRRSLQENPDRIGKLLAEARITSKQAEDWESFRTMTDAEALLDSWYPQGRQTRPGYWDDPAYHHPGQPVVCLSWHEARAYCAWLSAQTVIDLGGRAFRLPTEAEWEAAARGREGRRYPWGPGFDPARCNTFETHVRATTPVGVFPGGDSPEGVADLAGNVWEWTGSVYSPYPYRADDRRENQEDAEVRRVVRGGSWFFNRDYARCAYRNVNSPGYRGRFLGLRLVCVAPIA